MKLGIFGGTFDPPHLAHLILAEEAYYQLLLDGILWVLTPIPPHKNTKSITPWQHRLEMLTAAIGNNPSFEISRVDIERDPPHFAVDTMHILRRDYPTVELVYLLGGDSFIDLPKWHHSVEFVSACHALGVMHRTGIDEDLLNLEQHIPGIASKVQFVRAPLLEISASNIRARVASGAPFRYFLPEAVFYIIQQLNLYR